MGKSKHFTEEELEKIIYEYTVLKRGVNAIGAEFGVAGITIQRHLKKIGVHIRNFNEAMQECRAYNVNDDYFKVQSHNMAYILGLLASDGCVSKKTNHWYIDLQRQDEEILLKIKDEINFEGPIENYTNNQGSSYSRLRICSKQMKEDLAYYGITPQKTYTLKPPTFLASKYYLSYIRGYFDGDGCIHFNPKTNKYSWSICGASKNLLDWIQNILLNNYGIYSKIHTHPKKLKNGGDFYTLQIYKIESIIQLYKILYIPNSLYLNRKYIKCQNFYDIKSTRLYSLSDKEKRYAELIQSEE